MCAQCGATKSSTVPGGCGGGRGWWGADFKVFLVFLRPNTYYLPSCPQKCYDQLPQSPRGMQKRKVWGLRKPAISDKVLPDDCQEQNWTCTSGHTTLCSSKPENVAAGRENRILFFHLWTNILIYTCICRSWSHRMAWVGRDLKDHVVPWAGTPFTLLHRLLCFTDLPSFLCKYFSSLSQSKEVVCKLSEEYKQLRQDKCPWSSESGMIAAYSTC